MTSGCSAHGASPVPAWAPHAPAPPGCAQPPGAAETAPRERRAAAAPARAPGEAGGEMSAGVAAAQVPVTFEDVAVRFSAEEWQILEGWQKELHKEVMEENYQLLISLGQPVPTLALLALVAEREAAGGQICGISGERERELASDSGSSEGVELAFPEDDPDVGGFWDSGQTEEDGCPTGDEEGARQGSLHLSALMKLVKEIPEFLLGNSKATVEPAEAADSDAEMGSERAFADVKPEVTPETPPPLGLENCLGEVSVNRPSHPDTPSSCVSTSSTEGASLRRLYAEVAPENSPLQGLLNCLKEIPIHRPRYPNMQSPGAPGDVEHKRVRGEVKSLCAAVKTEVTTESSPIQGLTPLAVKRPSYPSTPTSSSSTSSAQGDVEDRRLELGLWRCSHEAGTAENSPLQGLLNCLKEIIVHKPRHPHPSPCKSAKGSTRGDPGQRRLEGEDGSSSVGVKTEVTAEDPQDPGWESCPPARPVRKASPPATPSSRAPRSRAEGEAGGRSLFGEEMTPRTSLLHDLANCLQETPVSTSWASRVLAHNAGADVSPRRPAMGMVRSWCGEDISTETSPLRGLENCLRDIPVNSPHMPASSALASPTQRDMGQRRPGAGARRSLGEDVSAENSPLRGLENCLKDIPVPCRSQSNTPGSRSSLSSSPAPRGRLETAGWPVKTEAGAVSEVTPPLQGLENCLKDIAMARPRGSSATSSFCTSKAPGEGEQRPVPRPWGACAAAASAESSPLYGWLNGLKEIPAGRPRYASVPSGYSSSSSADGERAPWGAGPGAWRWGSEELSPENSPLRGLEKCLQEISAPRPRTPSAPAPAAVVGSRQGEMGHWDWHGAATVSARVLGPESCLKALPGTRPSHAGRSSPHSTAGCSSPEAGISRFRAEDKRQVENLPGLEEVAAPSPCPAQAPPRSARGDAERREWDVHVRSSGSREVTAGSSPLPRLNGVKELAADRATPSSPPARAAQGDVALQGAESRGRTLSEEDSAAESAHLPGLEPCWGAVPVSRRSWASTPLGTSSSRSPRGAGGERGPRPGLCRRHREEVLPADAPRYGPATCPQETHGTGPGRSSTPSGTSPARDAPGHRHPRRPGTWVKRPHTEARTDAARPPSTGSCTSSEDGGQKADAEWEEFPKRHCSSAAPSPWACCGWESGMPLDLRVERSAIEVVLSEKLDRVSQDFAAMCRDVSSMQSRVAQLERDSRGWTLELAALQKGNKCLSETIRRLESRCHVLENRARRNSLRLVGLPEGAEGGDPVAFLQRTLPTMLNLPADWPPLEIESARRVHGGARWDPATRPQALLFRLLRFSDKLAIMRAVRKRAEPLTCGGARVALFPDVCPKLCRRRAARHAAVRRPWRAAELRLGTQPSGCCHGRARGHGEPLPSPPGRAPAADEQGSRVTKGQ
ncbi:protein KRBA1-like isoform X9 [Mauremys reevesii]|uniref:protein KRBA1-like isoform X9 n=1 Tax=Mauremys reevesii TaxID=260615 RepID=UPI00193F2560|nr:protein KRBA1-like isoform X9 [Mauremys reevesii]